MPGSLNANSKGFLLIWLIILGLLGGGGYFSWKSVFKPYLTERNLIKSEEIALQVLERLQSEGHSAFDIVTPDYMPKGFHLQMPMPMGEKGEKLNLVYIDKNFIRIDIMERVVSEVDKKNFFERLKIFPRDAVKLEGGITGYLMRSPITEESDKIPGAEQLGEITFRFGSVDITFIKDDMQVSITNTIMGDGELITNTEITDIANSILDKL